MVASYLQYRNQTFPKYLIKKQFSVEEISLKLRQGTLMLLILVPPVDKSGTSSPILGY